MRRCRWSRSVAKTRTLRAEVLTLRTTRRGWSAQVLLFPHRGPSARWVVNVRHDGQLAACLERFGTRWEAKRFAEWLLGGIWFGDAPDLAFKDDFGVFRWRLACAPGQKEEPRATYYASVDCYGSATERPSPKNPPPRGPLPPLLSPSDLAETP